MTHDEYLTRLDGFTDSSNDVERVLSHAAACAFCRRQTRVVERALSRLDSARRSIAEEVTRFGVTAAIVVMIVLGMNRLSVGPPVPTVSGPPRYRIVGNASGVVAHTPSGIVIGIGGESGARVKGVTP